MISEHKFILTVAKIMSQQAINDLLEILSDESTARTLQDFEVMLIGGGEAAHLLD